MLRHWCISVCLTELPPCVSALARGDEHKVRLGSEPQAVFQNNDKSQSSICCHRPFVFDAVWKRALPSKFSPPMHSLTFGVFWTFRTPLALHVGGANVEPVAVQNEPDRNFVRLPGLASIMGPCSWSVSQPRVSIG
jgi:hypothetical protein